MTHRSEVYGIAMKMLDGLPEGSVVLDSDGDAWQKQDVRWTSVVRAANTELMGSNSLAILTPLTVVHRGFEAEVQGEPSDAQVQKLQDELEYRVRTAAALAKGGHDIDEEVRAGRERIGKHAAALRAGSVR